MTREQIDAIRARVDAGTALGLSTQIEIDRDGTTRWVNLGPYPCATHEDAAQVRDLVTFIASARQDIPALLAEVERLTADPLPAAAWVREVERAAFARGVAAMREAARTGFVDEAKKWQREGEGEMELRYLRLAGDIRAIPDPEDEP